jgi:hypothetical protein
MTRDRSAGLQPALDIRSSKTVPNGNIIGRFKPVEDRRSGGKRSSPHHPCIHGSWKGEKFRPVGGGQKTNISQTFYGCRTKLLLFLNFSSFLLENV